ncbi:hypothetical protein GCG21_12690 [Pseudactinotalea sp. HY160]|uniref:hypothetical protein n=1 Tax=Pseudactinotalea sp. HY160 TaxID=2654490 RepID=UPI00128E8234|nr:hypothetical protein [Pseudactinotalea sp. HY160]MPV50851.1 hypothetical protein [Pseudactinotalea sp. HY160]
MVESVMGEAAERNRNRIILVVCLVAVLSLGSAGYMWFSSSTAAFMRQHVSDREPVSVEAYDDVAGAWLSAGVDDMLIVVAGMPDLLGATITFRAWDEQFILHLCEVEIPRFIAERPEKPLARVTFDIEVPGRDLPLMHYPLPLDCETLSDSLKSG